jgi:hypothetical protein
VAHCMRGSERARSRVKMPDNMSIDTDPQQKAAASPLMLVVRSFLR